MFVNGQWTDAAPYFLQNGYNAVIQDNDASAIQNRMAFTGNSEQFLLTRLDLSDFSGQTISIRFRFVSDAATGGEGWYIDDVQLDDAVVIQNFLHASFDGRENRTSCVTLITGEGIPGAGEENLKQLQGLSVYPNPADQEIFVKGEEGTTYTVQLLDNNGKVILEKHFSNQLTINSSALSDGVYILKVVSDTGILHRKLVIQH